MSVELTKEAIDLGIVTRDAEAALKFYRDTLGFKAIGEMPMPGTGTMHMLLCGRSMIKVVELEKEPKGDAPAPGGIRGAIGYRYWTISVSNLAEMLAACESGGYKVVVPETELQPGVSIGMVEDPDGNWVEFLST